MLATMSNVRRGAARAAFRLLNRAVLPPAKAGLTAPPPFGNGVVVLETTGRASGEPRQVPVAAVRVGDRFVVSTVRDNSQWLRNLEREPGATVWTWGRAHPVTATVRRGPINVVVLTPAAAEPAVL
jgi:deazaflavin-dependent oxidoreductase (nitroreductase family)